MSTSKLAYHAGEFGKQPSSLASFPGPAQLSVASSMEKREGVRFRARGEPGNKATLAKIQKCSEVTSGYFW